MSVGTREGARGHGRALETGEPKPTPESKARDFTKPMTKSHALHEIIEDVEAEPDNDVHPSGDDDDAKLPISDHWPDGWEDAEYDPVEPTSDWEDDPSAAMFGRRRPSIYFFRTTTGELDYRLTHRSTWVQMNMSHLADRDPKNKFQLSPVLRREQRLHLLAEYLIENQSAAISAPESREAYRRMEYTTIKQVKDKIRSLYNERDSSWVSRYNSELIVCPWGTVPFHFFVQWAPDPNTTRVEDNTIQKKKHVKVYNKIDVYKEYFDLILARFCYLDSNGTDSSSRERLEALKDDYQPPLGEAPPGTKIGIGKRRYTNYVQFLEDSLRRADSTHVVTRDNTFLANMSLRTDPTWHEQEPKLQEAAIEALASSAKVVKELVSGQRVRIAALQRCSRDWHDHAFKSRGLSQQFERGKELTRFAIAGWQPERGKNWYLVEGSTR